MSKKKSVFVTVVVSVMMAFVAIASNRIMYPLFVAIVSSFAALGFLSSAVAFCKWLEKPTEENDVDTIEPPIVGHPVENCDFTEIIDEVHRDAENKEK